MWYEVEDIRLGKLCAGATGEELTPIKKWSFGRLYGRLKKNGEKRSSMVAPYSIEVLYNGRPVGFLWYIGSNEEKGVWLKIKNQERKIHNVNHCVEILSTLKTVTEDYSELAMVDPKEHQFVDWSTDIFYKGELTGKFVRTLNQGIEAVFPVSPKIAKDLEDFSYAGNHAIKLGSVSALIYLIEFCELHETKSGKVSIKDIPYKLLERSYKLAISNMYRNALSSEGEYRNPVFRSIFKCSEKKFYERLTADLPVGFDLKDYHVDHIVPLSSAKKTVKELVRLNHFTNLRLLSAEANLYKRNTLPMDSELPSDLNRSVRRILDRAFAESEE